MQNFKRVSSISLIQIGSIQLQLYRKAIKQLRIRILPPDGNVRVSAPLRMSEKNIHQFVISNIPWIKKQQDYFANEPKPVVYKMLNGECHYLWGKPYHLNIVPQEGRHKIKVDEEKLNLYVNANASLAKKELALSRYYRVELKNRVETLLPYWKHRINVAPHFLGIKKMKTRWGSCNTTEKRIWLNLELAKKSPECLEYVLVHELVHLLEPSHNARFKAHMDEFLPGWRDCRNLLNRALLVHFNDKIG